MTRIAYVDAIGGAAGDMLLGALLDAGARLPAVQDAIDAVLPGHFRVMTEAVPRGGVYARLLRATTHREARELRSFPDLIGAVEAAMLPEQTRNLARAILRRLAEAEARVHGTDLANLRTHELGDPDTLLDIVGFAAALRSLDIEKVFASPLPLAVGGTVSGPHGDLPLPAPATLELLRGFTVVGAQNGEWVTPTAAAILAAAATPSPRLPAMTIDAVGYGAGTIETGSRPNVVRVIVGTQPVREIAERELAVIEANLDDLSPELVADAAEALRAGGALDVWTTPIQMKKGRSGVMLSALCEPDAEPRLRSVFFESTSTFGVRSHTVRRVELQRRVVTVPVDSGSVRVKVGLLAGRLISAKPEHDDVAELARVAGRPVRMIYEEAVAAARSLHRDG